MKTHCLFLLLFFSITTHLCSQKIEWEGTLRAKAIAASNSNPFWFSSNTDNEISSDSQFSILGNMSGAYKISEKAMITAGGAFFFRNGFSSQFVRRDLYIQFKNSWLQATIGSKAGELYSKTSESPFNKLSVSNRNFVYSRNARPLPGLLLEAHNPIKISNNFSVDWGIAHYNLNDNRFISDTKVHYKQLTLIGKLNNNNTLTGQLQHFVQWGGDSPVFGELNKDFSTFVDVFFALKSPEINVEGERLNAVGNHIGSYLLTYDFVTSAGNFSIYKEHPFEDGSGIIFSNFPDGVLGIGYQPKNNKFINSLLYEFITTKNQSTQEPGFQSYFFNNVYRSGWSYERTVIGNPFVIYNSSIEIDGVNGPIISNRFSAHHIGLEGEFKKINWMIKSTMITHFGTFANPFESSLTIWNNYLYLNYALNSASHINVIGGWDIGENADTSLGIGVGYSYSF